MLEYFARLTERIQRLGWDATDPAYKAAWAAYHELHRLNVELHYAAMPAGTGGKPSETP